MTRKYVKKPKRTKLVKKLDKIFSLYIRARDSILYDNCFFCRSNPIECCFHMIRRARYSVRWDDRNAVASCNYCNYCENNNNHPFVAKYIDAFGHELYLSLVEKSKIQPKHSLQELEKMISFFEAELSAIRLNPENAVGIRDVSPINSLGA